MTGDGVKVEINEVQRGVKIDNLHGVWEVGENGEDEAGWMQSSTYARRWPTEHPWRIGGVKMRGDADEVKHRLRWRCDVSEG